MDPEKYNLIITLNELQRAVGKGDIEKIEKRINWFHQNLARNKQHLSELYTSGIQCPTQTDLILAACQNKQADILYYIFNETDILVHLTDDSFNDTAVNQQRTEAFKHAIRLQNFNMVEMLYDYWCGNLHWIGHDVNNIKMVGKVLQNAFEACPFRDSQLVANCYTLIKFNDFQCEIYTKLAQLKPSGITPKDTATMLLKVLRDYDKYSHIERVRIQHPVKEHEVLTRAYLADKSTTYFRNFIHIRYEVYYRKLDFNVILLILENLSVLRKHLKDRLNKNIKTIYPKLYSRYEHDAKLYKEIECAIYYFIYRTSEDWRLYLPEVRRLTMEDPRDTIKRVILYKNVTFIMDQDKMYNGPVLFFERKYLKKCIKKLRKILRVHFICRDLVLVRSQNQMVKSKEPLLDDNYLQTIRYMSDHYSLKKIVYYIEAIQNTNDSDVLMIERVLHVIGEMLKGTDNSYHLSRSTNALLQIAISVETISQLNNIRNFLSHTKKGQLSTRVDMANTQAQTFAEIKQELIIIKQIINSVLDIYKPILDKSLLEKGYGLLEQRIEGLPYEASRRIDEIDRLYKIHEKDLFLESNQFIQEVWIPNGLTIQLLKEIPLILKNKTDIFSKIQFAKARLSNNVASILPAYIQNVRRTLQLITENNNNVIRINQQLFNYNKKLSDFPDSEEINGIQNTVKRLLNKNKKAKIDLELTKKIKNFKIHWNCIKEMLVFCRNDCELFASISHLNLNVDRPNTPTVRKVDNILTELEALCVMQRSTLAWIFGKRAVVWGLKIYRFFENWIGLRLYQKHFVAIEKLHNYTTIQLQDTRITREELIASLIKRLDQLKQTLLYPQQIPLSKHVVRFYCDVKFRVILEMLLADIANVLTECRIRLMYKSSKLLKEIDLGNVLDHGNPFLEVIGNVFNSHDLSAELLDKAMMFADDGESIEALYELFKGGMDYQTILAGDLLKMNDLQKVLYEQFKKSPNWESYARLTRY